MFKLAQPLEKALPCPFCGSDNVIIHEADHGSMSGYDKIECGNCLIEAWGWTLEDWNKRSPNTQPQQQTA
jgi:hypothetical protein